MIYLFRFDYLGTYFILLLLILLPINYIISSSETRSYFYPFFIIFLYFLIFLCFSIISLLYFFLLFEFIVIIMFLLLLISINSYYRIRSSFFLFVYSLLGSFTLVISLIILISSSSLNFAEICCHDLTLGNWSIIKASWFSLSSFLNSSLHSSFHLGHLSLFFLLIIFLIKIPMFPFNF